VQQENLREGKGRRKKKLTSCYSEEIYVIQSERFEAVPFLNQPQRGLH